MIMKVTIQSSNVLYSLIVINLLNKKKYQKANQTEQNLQLTMNYRY